MRPIKTLSLASLAVLASMTVMTNASGQWGPYSRMVPPMHHPMAPPMRPAYRPYHHYSRAVPGVRGRYGAPYRYGRMPGRVYSPPGTVRNMPSASPVKPAAPAMTAALAPAESPSKDDRREISLPQSAEIGVSQSDGGSLLTDANGMTLYTFDQDGSNQSQCVGGCAASWPPLTADQSADPAGDFSVFQRNDGSMQWAYKTKPLYTWVNDQKPGDITGDGVGGVWKVARP